MDKKYILLANLSYLPDFGGVENSLRHLAQEYRTLGFTPIILCCESQSKTYKPCERIDDAIVVRSPRRKGLLGAFKTLFGMAIFARSITKKRNVEFVISRNQISSFFVRLFINSKHIYVAPGFAKFQTADANVTTRKLTSIKKALTTTKRSINSWLDKQAISKSDRVFLFSENMKRQAMSLLGPENTRTNEFAIVKPGVSTLRFKPVDSQENVKLRAKYNLPKNDFVFLCIGRLVAAKGIDVAIKAIAKLPVNCSLVIAGDGIEKESLTKLAIDLGVEGRVHFLGAVNNPEYIYSVSDAFLMTSRYEPLGQTILEAAATGLQIISFKNDSSIDETSNVTNATKEILDDFAYYSDAFDAGALALEMTKVATLDVSIREENKKALIGLVKAKYTWNSLAKQLIGL